MVYLTWNINSLITSQLNFFQLTALKPTDRGPTVLGSLRTLSLSVKWGSKKQRGRQAPERFLPADQMMGEQPRITGCLATKRLPRDSKRWERGGHKMDHKMDEKREPSGDHLVSSQPQSSDYIRLWSGPKTQKAKTQPKNSSRHPAGRFVKTK